MLIGTYKIELFIKDSHSLKEKRRIVKSLIDRIRKRYNVAISEIGNNNSSNYATIGIAYIGNNKSSINSSLSKIYHLISTLPNLDVIGAKLEIY